MRSTRSTSSGTCTTTSSTLRKRRWRQSPQRSGYTTLVRAMRNRSSSTGRCRGQRWSLTERSCQEGVDYTWKAWGDNGSCTDPGEYDVMLFGKGRFAGNAQVHYAIEPAPEPLPQPEPEPTPEPSPTPTTKSKLSFDLAGGTLDGQTGTVVIEAEKGSVIDILAAPTRDGYVFQY